MKTIKEKELPKFIAYDSANNMYEKFNTLKEAKAWLIENDNKGISKESIEGEDFIAKVKYRSVLAIIEKGKENNEFDILFKRKFKTIKD